MNKTQQGFTLVEVVISLALGSLILTAIMSLFVSFVQVWQVKKTPYESFIEHVDNCTRFLYNRLNSFENVFNEKVSASNGGGNTSIPTKSFHCIKLAATEATLGGPWVLGMKSYKGLPFLYRSPSEKSSIIHGIALVLTPKGLGLILESPEIVKQHLNDGVEYTDKTTKKYIVLSPYVTDLEYAHFDPNKGQWEFTTSLEQFCKQFADKNFHQRPDGLRLKFKQEDFEAQRFIFIHNDFFGNREVNSKSSHQKEGKK